MTKWTGPLSRWTWWRTSLPEQTRHRLCSRARPKLGPWYREGTGQRQPLPLVYSFGKIEISSDRISVADIDAIWWSGNLNLNALGVLPTYSSSSTQLNHLKITNASLKDLWGFSGIAFPDLCWIQKCKSATKLNWTSNVSTKQSYSSGLHGHSPPHTS